MQKNAYSRWKVFVTASNCVMGSSRVVAEVINSSAPCDCIARK